MEAHKLKVYGDPCAYRCEISSESEFQQVEKNEEKNIQRSKSNWACLCFCDGANREGICLPSYKMRTGSVVFPQTSLRHKQIFGRIPAFKKD